MRMRYFDEIKDIFFIASYEIEPIYTKTYMLPTKKKKTIVQISAKGSKKDMLFTTDKTTTRFG